ncbi:phage tail tape measure protein [Ruminiclostridium josui]|uniref:phage tail tape measure protein n=1 Tax=Ruminiclostridium josui TaxID=1499 RepID=UPI0006D04C59|nr:phage tail tape measure protein [Ruminiclostridium josui]
MATDDSIVRIMESLGLDYSPAINSTIKFEKNISDLQAQLIALKSTAGQTAKDINTSFAAELDKFKTQGIGIPVKDISQSKVILDQYGNTLVDIGKKADDAKKRQSKLNKELADLIHLRKTQQIDAQTFVDKVSPFRTNTSVWESLQKQEQVKLVSELTKAEKEHTSVLSRKQNTEKAISKEIEKQNQLIYKQLQDEEKAKTKSRTNNIPSSSSVSSDKEFGIIDSEIKRRVSWFATGAGFYGIINAGKEAVQTISEVESGVTDIARVMEDSTFIFNDYRDELLQFGVDYGQTFDVVQDIALRWAQAGYNVSDSLENTKTSLLALNTAELDASNATESMIGIMSQWQMTSKDLPLMLDKINKTADDFTVTSQDLVDGLLRSSGAAKIMGLSLDQTISLLTVMREASGRTGREVGNALNSILSYVQRPSSIKTFESMGIKVFADNARTQFRNVMDIFQDVSSKWDTVGKDIQEGFLKSADDAGLFSEEMATALGMQERWNDLQQRDLSQAAAGVYRRNYFIGMIERMSGAQEVLNNMTDAAGYSQSENARTMETLSKKYQSLTAQAQELAVAIGDSGVEDFLKGLTDFGTEGLRDISAVVKQIGLLPPALATALATLSMFRKEMQIFQGKTSGVFGLNINQDSAIGGMKSLLKTTKDFYNVQMSLARTQGITNVSTWQKVATGVGSFTRALNMATIASKALGFALNTAINVGIGIAIGLAVEGIYKLINAEKESKEVSKQTSEQFKEQQQALMQLRQQYIDIASAGNLTAQSKADLKSIQDQLIKTYGLEAQGLDLVNGKYQEQIKLIDAATVKKAKETMASMGANADDARNKLNQTHTYKIDSSFSDEIKNAISGISGVELEHDIFNTTLTRAFRGTSDTLKFTGTIEDTANALEQLIIKLQAVPNKNTALINTISELSNKFNKVKKEASEARQTIDTYAQAKNIVDFNDALKVQIDNFNQLSSEMAKAGDKSEYETKLENLKNQMTESAKAQGKLTEFAPLIDDLFSKISSGSQHANADVSSLDNNIDAFGTNIEDVIKYINSLVGDIKSLNQTIYNLSQNQSLNAEQTYDLIDKYPELADNIIATANGYKIEESALEELRLAKIDEQKAALDAEAEKTKATLISTSNRLSLYSSEIEAIKDLQSAQSVYSGLQLSYSSLSYADYSQVRAASGLDNPYGSEQDYNEAIKAGKKILQLGELYESIEKKKQLISSKKFGVSTSSSSSGGRKEGNKSYENKALEQSLKLLEHRKNMSEETVASIQAEIKELNRINSAYVKTGDERMDIEERIYSAQKRLKDKKFKDSTDWINYQKELGKLSIKQEIDAWEKILKTQKDNSEAVKQATINLYKLKTQLAEESAQKEENSIEHWAKLGIYSVQQQIDKYRELYRIKAKDQAEEYKRTENLFDLYKDLLNEQQKSIKDAYDERIQQIEDEAKKKKEAQQAIIDGIEAEEKALERLEGEHDYSNEMANLREQLAYWSVRTSEEARKNVADLNKQIAEKEHDHEVELQKQTLEDKKQTAQDAIDAIEKAANDEKEKWETSYKLIEKAFEEHSIDIVARAGTMSQQAYQKWVDNYLSPLQNALKSGNINTFEKDSGKFQESINSLHHMIGECLIKIIRILLQTGNNGRHFKQKVIKKQIIKKCNSFIQRTMIYAKNTDRILLQVHILNFIQVLKLSHMAGLISNLENLYFLPIYQLI